MMGMISSLLVFQLGQARVWFAMSRDGLLPRIFGRVHPRFRTPSTATWIAGFVVGVPAGILDIGTLADLSNIDRKSTRLNSSHLVNSDAVFCLKNKRPAPGRADRQLPAARRVRGDHRQAVVGAVIDEHETGAGAGRVELQAGPLGGVDQ